MSKNRDMLSGVQIMILVNSSIMGVGLLSLPRYAAETMGINAVLGVLIAGIIAVGMTMVIGILCRRFPSQTVLDFSNSILGKWLTKLLNLIFIVYPTVVTASTLRRFADVSKVFLLQDIPVEIIIFSMLIISSYLTRNGINPIARICEVFFPISMISIIVFLLLCLPDFNIKELYSIRQVDIISIVKGLPSIIFTYLGFGVLLFATAFMSEPKKVVWHGSAGTAIAVVIYILTTFIAIGVFSVDSLRFQMYPTLELARIAHLPAGFAERFDIFFAVFWILAIFTTVVINHYIAAFSSTKLFGMKNYRPFCYLLLPIIYIIALIPQNISESIIFFRWIAYLGGLVVVIIPTVLLIGALLRKKGGAKVEKAT